MSASTITSDGPARKKMGTLTYLAVTVLLTNPPIGLAAQAVPEAEQAAATWAISLVRNEWRKSGTILFDERKVPRPAADRRTGPEWSGPHSRTELAALTSGRAGVRIGSVDQAVTCERAPAAAVARCSMDDDAAIAVSEPDSSGNGHFLVRVRVWERVTDGDLPRVTKREYELTLDKTEAGWRVVDVRLAFHAG